MPSNPFYGSPFWKDLRREALDRDHHRCTVPGCPNTQRMGRLYVDHIDTRPNVPYPTAHDILSNLRTLCGVHDAMIKEQRGGRRRRDGKLTVRGCDAAGNPTDPLHHWNTRP
jgi:5-methylcytosine-specific restriction protein A